jgi:RecA/RadA recombinase
MKPKTTNPAHPSKARTGIEGFDEITHGGLPRGRTTLLEGGPGSGKTLMALQTLVNGARLDNAAGPVNDTAPQPQLSFMQFMVDSSLRRWCRACRSAICGW